MPTIPLIEQQTLYMHFLSLNLVNFSVKTECSLFQPAWYTYLFMDKKDRIAMPNGNILLFGCGILGKSTLSRNKKTRFRVFQQHINTRLSMDLHQRNYINSNMPISIMLSFKGIFQEYCVVITQSAYIGYMHSQHPLSSFFMVFSIFSCLIAIKLASPI